MIFVICHCGNVAFVQKSKHNDNKMKKIYLITFISCFMMITNVQLKAQATIDFETGGKGAAYSWNVFENGSNPAIEIVANPNATGVNTSSTVAKFTAKVAGQPYAGAESAHGDFGPLTFDASNSIVTIMVYKTLISDVGLKFAESNGEAQPEVKVANTKINEWEKLTFDLSGSIGKGVTKVIDQIIVFPDFATRAQDNIVYFDNITFGDGGTSNSETTLNNLLVDGKTVPGFSPGKLDYIVELPEGTTTVPTVTAVSTTSTSAVTIIAATAIPGTTTVEVSAQEGTAKTTYSVAFKIKEAPIGSIVPVIDFEAGGKGASYTWNVFENGSNPAIEIVANPDASGANTSSTVAKFTAKQDGQPYAGAESAHGDFGPLTFDASNSIVTIMVYKTVISDVGLKFAESNGEAQPEVKVANTKINEWEKLTFDLSGSIGKGVTKVIDQIIVFPDYTTRSQDNIIYFDNITFGDPGNGTSDEYVLVWSDEFTEDGAISSSKWHHQTQLPAGGNWYNNEAQHYTNRLENSYTDQGYLNIVAKKESFTDQGATKEYTSARLNSKYAFKYGRVDVSAKLPSGAGTWPAIWMLGKNINEPGGYWSDEFGNVNWPATGEIDIMEHWGNNPNVIHGSIHTTSSSGATVNTGTKVIADVSSSFHVYSIIWDKNEIQFLIDDINFYTYNPSDKNPATWPFDEPQYLLLNIAMGGIGGSIDPAFTESAMEIDYVRVYQKESESEETATEPVVAAPTPTPDASNVISIFSDSYNNVSGTNFDPDWEQTTNATQVEIAGNNTLLYTGLNYQGIELGSAQDVSAMKSLHVDYWTANSTALAVSLISTGPAENKSDLTISKGKWVSVDVPLTDFTVPALNDIIQLKFEGNGTVYLDNIYFTSGDGTGSSSNSLSDLLVNGQTVSGFSPSVLSYTVELAEGTTTVPTVTAVSEVSTSSVVITPAAAIPGTTTIAVTAQGATTAKTYSVAFKTKSVVAGPSTLPIDFEGAAYGFTDFDGGKATVISNPHNNADNSSAKVAQIVRNGGAQWGGSKLKLATKIDFSVNNSFSMKVYSTRSDVPVLFKLEGPNAAAEVMSKTTIANGWETITWDFTGTASNTFDDLVFMFDFGTVGDGGANSTFLFDDVQMFDNTGGLDQIAMPVTFESETTNYAMGDFGGNSTVMGEDPMNASNTVAITTKTSGAETWAGTTLGTSQGFASAMPFTESETKVNIKIYSPAAGITIRLKAEDHKDETLTVETEAITTKANQWEILTFDFSNVATGTNPFNLSTKFDMVSIFFNFGKQGTGQVFYWDDVFFGEAADPVGPLGYVETSDLIIYSKDGQLFVNGTPSLVDSKISIYNISGVKVSEGVISDTETILNFNEKGILIVRIEDLQERKLIVRKIFMD